MNHLRSSLILIVWPSPCCQLNDGFVDESLLARVKEEPEVTPEFGEEKLDDFRLVFWLEQLVEWELFNDQIVVVLECFLCVVRNASEQYWRHEDILLVVICFLQLHDPYVHFFRVLREHVIESTADLHKLHEKCHHGGEEQ